MNAKDLAALHRLVAAFGDKVLVREQQLPFPRTRRELINAQVNIEDLIIDRCQERGGQMAVLPRWPLVSIDRAQRIAVIGPSADRLDNRNGRLGTSAADSLLLQTLRQAGVRSDAVGHLATVFHWTADETLTHNRPPTPAEQHDARADLFDALEAADVEYVLLHGAHALRAWRTDLSLQQVAGGLYLWRDRWMVGVVAHGSAVLRRDGYDYKQWSEQVRGFARFVLDHAGFEEFGARCVEKGCGAGMYAWDADGVPWCRGHFDAGVKGREAVERRDGKRYGARQVGMVFSDSSNQQQQDTTTGDMT